VTGMRYLSIAACSLAIVLSGLWSRVATEDHALTQDCPTGITVPPTCPITQPPLQEFVPPAPYPTKIAPDAFWLGSEKLWTGLSKNGTWRGYWGTEPDSGVRRKIYFEKVFWWRRGYDWRLENPPQLKVSGRRLDAPAALFVSNRANPAFLKNPAMLTGIDPPTSGCWEITGNYKGDKLSFVVWVVDPPKSYSCRLDESDCTLVRKVKPTSRRQPKAKPGN
jgi:hypothetical protein